MPERGPGTAAESQPLKASERGEPTLNVLLSEIVVNGGGASAAYQEIIARFDALGDRVWRAEGMRHSAVDEAKRLRAITKDKRDLIALINELETENQRLGHQTNDFWKAMHEQRVIEKRRQAQRLRVSMGGLHLAVRWLRHFADGEDEPEAPLHDVIEAWEIAISPSRLLEQADAVGE